MRWRTDSGLGRAAVHGAGRTQPGLARRLLVGCSSRGRVRPGWHRAAVQGGPLARARPGRGSATGWHGREAVGPWREREREQREGREMRGERDRRGTQQGAAAAGTGSHARAVLGIDGPLVGRLGSEVFVFFQFRNTFLDSSKIHKKYTKTIYE
jgi:hypothetical protein